jgi:SAM-dependent methyltransferase
LSLALCLLKDASEPYRAAGRYAFLFARGKFAHDPVFEAILARGLLTQCARILDLGCGQGLLAALLLAARRAGSSGAWPDHWPPAPQPSIIRGIDLVSHHVSRARLALTCRAEFVTGDVRETDFGSVDGVVILDVLHYLEYAEQCSILERVHKALIADGILLLRVGNAADGFGFSLGKWVDQMVLLSRGHRLKPLHCRSTGEWRDLLSQTGFDSETMPMSVGTPFANVLIIARPR